MEAIERVLQIRRLLTYNILAWCLLGILSAVQRYSYAISFGQEFSWQSLIRHPLSTYLAYWTLSYLVIDLFLLSRRWHTRRFVILHIPASAVFSLLHKLMAYISGLLLERLFLPEETLNWQELIVLWQASWFDLIIGVAVYWIILFVLMALDYWQQFREQYSQSAMLRNQLTEAQLQSMRMQLQPHFLFNALNTITMMVRRKDQQQAISMIIGLSEMLRNSLSQNKRPFIQLEEELKLIGHYLQVEQGRFHDRLQLTMDIEETTLDMVVPNLILQPIVENAFKHGIAHSMDQAILRLSSRYEDGFLVLEVFNSTDVAHHEWVLSKSKGIGLRNTIGRLRQLYKGRARLQFTEQENGVLVSLRLPASTEHAKFTVKGQLEEQ